MGRLVALDVVGGPPFVDAVRRCWAAGDAVLVPGEGLPPARRADLLARAGVHTVVTADDPAGLTVDRAAPPVADGDALVVATSGSTGAPKLVVHTHDSLLAHARAVHERLGVDPDRDRWLACLPLSHLGGFGVVARSILTGTPLDVARPFDAELVGSAPATLGSTLVSLVTTALDRLDAGSFRWVVLGGSADAADRPANVVRTYGLTETGGGVVYGGVPLSGVEVRVDELGQVSLRSPTIARGQRTTEGEVVPLVDDAGWLATGDLGRWDVGSLRIDGRADDLIVSGGENVWPEPVEAALLAHPGVIDAAVVGAPDPEWGQRVVALVVPVDATSPPTLDDLRAHVKTTLAPAWAPRAVHLVTAVPRTPSGKVRRAALVGQYGLAM